MLGRENVANPTLTSLGGRFGLAPLVGKQAAIVGDAHLGRQSDSVAILERLKSIVGGDPQNVDRKGISELTNVPIKARFTISVNEIPRLPDASAALRSRTIIIPFDRTFEGKEDFGLSDKLITEIPGITNWALQGLRDLRESGRVLFPKAGRELLNEFVRLSSPHKAFVEDCCNVGPDRQVRANDLKTAWKLWCEDNGHEAGSATAFGIRLRAAVPGINKARKRNEGKLDYYYEGLSLVDAVSKKVNNRLRGLY